MSKVSTPRTPVRVDRDLADKRISVADAQRRIQPWRVIVGIFLAITTAQILVFLVTNERFEWPVVGEYLFNGSVLTGLAMSIMLTVVCMVLGSVLGTILAAGQLSEFVPLKLACIVFVGVFRGVPPLVQLIFWYNLAYLLPRISLQLPFGIGPEITGWSTNDVITPLTAAIIGLSLHQSAYMAEIIRAGITSVDSGQRDAAAAMGFSRWHAFRSVVLPQAMRVILPPSGSQVIALMKGTSLVSVIAMGDLLHAVQIIYNRTYDVVPMLIVAVLWYLTAVTLLTIAQRRVERYFSKGMERTKAEPGAPHRVEAAT